MNSIQSALTCVHSPTRVPPGNLARSQAGSPDNIKNDNLSGYLAGYPAGHQSDTHVIPTVQNQNVVADKPTNSGGWTDVFVHVFKRQPDAMCHSDVAFYLKRGMSEDVIKLAIYAACDAKETTWKYAVTVMRNCLREQIFDMDGFLERSKTYYRQRTESASSTQQIQRTKYQATVPAQMYTQRDYTMEELDALFEVV